MPQLCCRVRWSMWSASYSIIGVCRFSREAYVSNVWAFVARLMWFYWQDGLCFRIPAVREQASAVVTHSHSLLSRGPPKAASVWELGRGPAPLKHAHTQTTIHSLRLYCATFLFLLCSLRFFYYSPGLHLFDPETRAQLYLDSFLVGKFWKQNCISIVFI